MDDQNTQTRRAFISTTSATLGGLVVSGTVGASQKTNRFIINTKKKHETSDLEIIHRLDSVNLLVVRGSEEAVRKGSKDYVPDIITSLDRPVDPQKPPEKDGATNEPLFEAQWDKQVQNIPAAHNISRGEGSRVAVIDTGIDPVHPDLQHALNEDLSRNFTEDGGDYSDIGFHGTHVSGIIAANDQNTQGIVGSAPGTDLVALRVFQQFSGAPFGDILAAIIYSANIEADVANLSLGTLTFRRGLGPFYGKALNRTMTYANKEGTLLVISAGNFGQDLQNDAGLISLPNEGAQGLSISATGPVGFDPTTEKIKKPPYAPTSYTNYGTNAIDIAAPGGRIDSDIEDRILSTVPTDLSSSDSYAYLAGTSMAAPQVTGAAALIASTYSDSMNSNEIANGLKRAASIPDEYNKQYYGSGFIDVLSAVEK